MKRKDYRINYGLAICSACAGFFFSILLNPLLVSVDQDKTPLPKKSSLILRQRDNNSTSSQNSPRAVLELAETICHEQSHLLPPTKWPKWRHAWLAGVCADSLGSHQSATNWMSKFEEYFDVKEQNFRDTDIRYLTIVAARFKNKPQFSSTLWPACLFGMVVNGNVNPLPQIIDELKKSRKAITDDNIVERVRLMSWLLLAGEIIVESENGSPSAGLLRNAINAFDEGFTILADLEQTFAEYPAQESLLTSTPENALVAMRLDAVRVRKASIESRESLAKEKEFERLDALRELIAAEKSLMDEVGRTSFAVMNHDWIGVRDAGDKALEHVASMQEITRKKRDYYLLEEPKAISTDNQWSAIDPAITPVSSGVVSSVKSMIALAAARLAEVKLSVLVENQNNGGEKETDKEKEIIHLLDSSDSLVQRATGKIDDDPADGFDPENAIAPYVKGLISEMRARLSTYSKIGDANLLRGVEDLTKKAKDEFKGLEPKFEKWGADVAAAYLLEDAERRIEALSDESIALVEANSLSKSGHVDKAWDLLGQSAEVIGSQEVLLERANAARRAKRNTKDTLAELDRAEASRLIPADDIDAAITRTGLVLQDIGVLLSTRQASEVARVDQAHALAELTAIEKKLKTAIEKAATDNPALPKAWAWLSLCLAYKSQETSEPEVIERLVKETKRLAQDALFELNKSPPKSDDWNPGHVEAVVAAQLALGHAAAKALPSYRDESRLAFAAAIDNSTSLPFNNAHFRLLGSPLLSALAAGDSGGSGKLAQEERALRQMMTRFVEASFALRFGDQQSAADQMEEAVRLHTATSSKKGSQFDASSELQQADGFDVHISLPDSIRAFAAMSQTNTGNPEEALRTLLAITIPEPSLPTALGWPLTEDGKNLVNQAISKSQSPLVALALALALEEVVDGVDISDVEMVEPLIVLAVKSHMRTSELLKAARVADRYPHIIFLNTQLGMRLKDANHQQAVAQAKQAKGDIIGAIAALRAAIRRQPREQLLWKTLLSLEVNRISADPTNAAITDLRAEVKQAAKLGLLDDYQSHFYSGELNFLEKRYSEAATQFDQAAAIAATETEKAQAIAKAAIARIRIQQRVAKTVQLKETLAAIN